MPLKDAFFVGAQLHARPVPMADGSTETIHFRELPWAEWYGYQTDRVSEDAGVRKAAIARLIAESVREPDGSPALTQERAKDLKTDVMNALLAVVIEIQVQSAAVAKKPLPSEAPSGSGTS